MYIPTEADGSAPCSRPLNRNGSPSASVTRGPADGGGPKKQGAENIRSPRGMAAEHTRYLTMRQSFWK